jgi:uncharacterized protein (UPF0335 family)
VFLSNRQLDTAAPKAAIQAIETLDAEVQSLNEDKKAAYAKARAAGLNTKVLKALIHERRIPPDEVDRFRDLLAAYRKVIGR